MSEREDTAELRPEPRHLRRRGGGRFALMLAMIAIVAIAVYLLIVPAARRALTKLDAHYVHPPATTPAAPDRQTEALANQIDALRQRVAVLEQQVAHLAVPGAPAAGSDAPSVALSGRLDAIAARQDRDEAEEAATAAALSEAKTWLATTDRRFRLLDAATALAAGQPLGAIADAPPALARFAAVAPPTQAGLRAAFPAVARAARQAAQGHGLWAAFKARLAGLVTIRDGDRVMMGSTVLAAIDRAGAAVEADDLAGAIAALAGLTGAPASAVAAWRGQAQALLDARAALAHMEAAG